MRFPLCPVLRRHTRSQALLINHLRTAWNVDNDYRGRLSRSKLTMFEHSCQPSSFQVAYQNQKSASSSPCKLPSEPQASSLCVCVWGGECLFVFKSTLRGHVSLFPAGTLTLALVEKAHYTLAETIIGSSVGGCDSSHIPLIFPWGLNGGSSVSAVGPGGGRVVPSW